VRGKGREREGTASGWQLIVRTEARTRMPPAVKVVKVMKDREQGGLWRQALRMPTPAKVAGVAHRRQPDCDKRGGDGVDLCWLDPKDARAQATAAGGMTIGGWVLEVDDDAYRSFPEGSPQCAFATSISTS
jgi:hypothetical protein